MSHRLLHPLAGAYTKQTRTHGTVWPVFRHQETQARWWAVCSTRTRSLLRYSRPGVVPPWVDMVAMKRHLRSVNTDVPARPAPDGERGTA